MSGNHVNSEGKFILDKMYETYQKIAMPKKRGGLWGCLVDKYMRKKKFYLMLEHLIKCEWNTCISADTQSDRLLEFLGFYGYYNISVETGDLCVKKQNVSFD